MDMQIKSWWSFKDYDKISNYPKILAKIWFHMAIYVYSTSDIVNPTLNSAFNDSKNAL